MDLSDRSILRAVELAYAAAEEPRPLSQAEETAVQQRLAGGESVAALARDFQTSRQTIMRARGAALTV